MIFGTPEQQPDFDGNAKIESEDIETSFIRI